MDRDCQDKENQEESIRVLNLNFKISNHPAELCFYPDNLCPSLFESVSRYQR
jgi:hypothetical protein